jgi:hypothetical protein
MMMQGKQLVRQQLQKWVAADPVQRAPIARSLVAGRLPIWNNNLVKWCHDPQINVVSLDAFKGAIEQIEKAMPGCIRF